MCNSKEGLKEEKERGGIGRCSCEGEGRRERWDMKVNEGGVKERAREVCQYCFWCCCCGFVLIE